MAHSLVTSLRACALALAISFAAGAQNDEPEELVFESGPVTFNRQTNLFEAQAVRITQGNLSIEADHSLATAIDFTEQSEWRFTRVKITVGTAVMEAGSAVFTFDNERLSRGELSGTPVSFSDFDEVRQMPILGRAQQMSYDYVARKLRMIGEAWVQRGRTEMFGCDLNYDFAAAERDAGLVVTMDSDECADKFRVRVLPDPEDQPDATDTPR
jgi:lipopolysaccharide transport protein LptA